MSKWTEMRDDIVESLQVEEVTEQVKKNLTRQIVESILPAVKTAADGFISKIKEQAKTEYGRSQKERYSFEYPDKRRTQRRISKCL